MDSAFAEAEHPPFIMRLSGRAKLFGAVLAWMLAVGVVAAAEDAAEPLGKIAARASRGGHTKLAELVTTWDVHEFVDRLPVLRIEPSDGNGSWSAAPEWVEGAEAAAIWRSFVEARKARAASWLDRAVEVAGGGRDGAVTMLFRALREDPDCPQARAAIGWVRRDGRWVWPEAARRIDRGEVFSPGFGWLPKSRLPRYVAGERYADGRWVDATEAAKPRPIDRGWKVASDHWEIASTAAVERAAALAATLEESRIAWLQAFGGFAIEPRQGVDRIAGRSRAEPRKPLAASLVRDRAEYAKLLTPLEPAAGRTLGLYWNPTRTAWFFDTDDDGRAVGPATSTVLHESTHQLFAESRETIPAPGERCGFWAIEAVACFMESLEPAAFGWTLGGPEAGRGPIARERLVEDGFHVPLRELVAMGRRRFQADDRLPMIYSEISGLADFFLCGERGRHRAAFVEYLRRIYAGTDEPDTLSSLCGRSFEDLDDDYRRFMASRTPPASR